MGSRRSVDVDHKHVKVTTIRTVRDRTSDATSTSSSSNKPSNRPHVPVNTVLCIDTSPGRNASDFTQNSIPAASAHDEEDDFPYLRSGGSIHMTPDNALKRTTTTIRTNESQTIDLFANDALKDDQILALFDSPDTKALETPHSDISSAPKSPDIIKITSRQTSQARESPMLESPHSDVLEVPRPITPDGLEEAASRFFQGKDGENEMASLSRTSAIRVASPNMAEFLQRQPNFDGESFNKVRSLQQEPEPAMVVEAHSVRPEVEPLLYQPPHFRNRQDPIVYYLSTHNRPINTRQRYPVSDLFSSPIHQLWQSKFDTFNSNQKSPISWLIATIVSVVSAPTGAGKTALFEIAMARLFANDLEEQNNQPFGSTQQVTNRHKIVYVAPSKALCEEWYKDWSRRLSAMNIGIQCTVITGDAEPGDSDRELAAGNVNFATPEKWDSLTRRWTEHVFLFGSVKLLMIDEGTSSRRR